MSHGKTAAILVLLSIYSIGIFILMLAVDVEVFSIWTMLVISCSVAASIAIICDRLITLYYVQFLAFTLFGYALQSSLGFRYLGWASINTEIGYFAASVFLVHLFGVTLGGVMARKPATTASSAPMPDGRAVVATVCTCILVVFLVFLIRPENFFLLRFERFRSGGEIGSVEKILEFIAKSVFFLLGAALLLQLRRLDQSGTRLALLAGVIAVAVFLSNPSTTPRFISLTGLSFLLVAGAFRMRSLGILRLYAILSPVLLLALLPLTSVLRQGVANFDTEGLLDMLTSLELSSFQLYLDALEYLEISDRSSLYTLTSFLIMVPRSIWPGKEDAIGVEVASYFGYLYDNASVPSYVNFYVDWGVFGLLAGSLAMGWLMGKFDFSGLTQIDFRGRRAMYGVMVFCLVPIIGRGDMSTALIAVYGFALSYEIVRAFSRFTAVSSEKGRSGESRIAGAHRDRP